jgi:hypothetical protein
MSSRKLFGAGKFGICFAGLLTVAAVIRAAPNIDATTDKTQKNGPNWLGGFESPLRFFFGRRFIFGQCLRDFVENGV